MEWLCAFCHKTWVCIITKDHTPLAKLICPNCCKKMGIEVQTHPLEPENEDNPFSGC